MVVVGYGASRPFHFTSFCYVLNLIFGFGFVIIWIIEIFCEHWYYSKRMPSAFVSKSLLTNSSIINSFSDGCITPSRYYSVTFWYYLFIFQLSIINPTTLSNQWHSAGGNNQPHTHTFSFLTIYIDMVSFISNRIESNQLIRRQQHHHNSIIDWWAK